MLDSIYHMTLKLLKICIFGGKMSRFCHLLCNSIMLNRSHCVTLLNLLSILLYGVKPPLDATSCDKHRIQDIQIAKKVAIENINFNINISSGFL